MDMKRISMLQAGNVSAGKSAFKPKAKEIDAFGSDGVSIGNRMEALPKKPDFAAAKAHKSMGNEGSKLKNVAKKGVLWMMIGLSLATVGLAGCSPSGGEAGQAKQAETQVERAAEEAAEKGKESGGSILDKFLTPEGRQGLKDLAGEAGKIYEDPSAAKDKAVDFVWDQAEKAQGEAEKAAKDFLEKDAEGLKEAADKLKEGDMDSIGENADSLLKKGAEYVGKKVEEAKGVAGETTETAKETGKSLSDLWSDLKEGYQKGKAEKAAERAKEK